MKFIFKTALIATIEPFLMNIYNAILVIYYESTGVHLSKKLLTGLTEEGVQNVLTAGLHGVYTFLVCAAAYPAARIIWFVLRKIAEKIPVYE